MPAVCDGFMVAVNDWIPDQVLATFSSGTVAPLVPVLTVAAVPSPKLVRAAPADVAPVPPFAMGSVPPRPDRDTVPQAGAAEGPDDIITWPAVDPAGLSRDGGVRVAAMTVLHRAIRPAPMRMIFRMPAS
ncbi:hypothetical protein AXY46_03005 [Achromobacter xylosoxidans]|nr:hypothetical protein AXY46_03005 [Achromobacter xylosoxidans]